MKILIVPSNDWIYSPVCRLHEIAEILGKNNDVYVWHFKLPTTKKFFHSVSKVKVVTPITIPTGDIATFYAMNFVLHAAQFAKVVRKLNIDVIVTQNPLPTQWVFPLAPSKTLKVFDMQDYYPESASIYYRNFPQSITHILESAVWRATKNSIKLADICLCNTVSFMNLVKEAGSKKTCFWPNGVDTTLFDGNKNRKNDLARKLGLNEHTIVFFGLIEPWLDFQTVFEGLKLLKKDIHDVRLLIVGSSITKYSTKVQKLINDSGLTSNVVMTGYVPDSELPDYLNLGNLGIMPYGTSTYSEKIRLPLKFFIYSAMGKPILSVPLPEVMQFKPKHVFYYKDIESFAAVAKMILQDYALQKKLCSYAREFSKKFDYQVLAQNLENIFKENLDSRVTPK